MNKKMLMFSYDFPPLEGGISRLCDAIIKEFQKRNWSVEALSIKMNMEKGYTYIPYNVYRVSNKRILRELESFLKLKKISKDTVIITDVWHPEGWISMLAGHKKVVILAHGNDVMRGKKTLKNILLNIFRKKILEKASLIICNSEYTKGLIQEQTYNANVVTCSLGVDVDKFKPLQDKEKLRKYFDLPTDKKILLTVSRVVKYKAHDVVLKALSILPEEIKSQICYCIAGRGDYLETLKKIAKDLNVFDNVKWLGFVNDEDLPHLYNASDLFVLCTREEKDEKCVEGFGLVFLEAQACGVPVIGVKQGGIPDAVIHNNGGWLIERDDYKELAKYFIELVKNEEKFKKEGKKARIRVENEATWEHFSSKVFSAIQKYIKV